ncbi:ATP-binding protein [Methanospirillum hungatei]|uniref:ATP-binding protein n=1 Tax=Methanospirillum hungatei TaxID=2203 RepID=UPI0026EC4650|nr:ATP-binding protein [Methanospirillum hungatei]MCA1916397.1 ATP-binding protein [Methanospirillum hungatei]
MKRPIPYGIMNYAELVRDNAYFVDKTRFIAKLEGIHNPVYLRPRRFVKSLFCSMLHYYYDRAQEKRFEELFGHTWIGKNPTARHNQFIVLKLDFSEIGVSGAQTSLEEKFHLYCNERITSLSAVYPDIMQDIPPVRPELDSCMNLSIWLDNLQKRGSPRVYVIIDEYDNFANQLITSYQDHTYQDMTSGDNFLRTFFKVLKAGRQTDAIENIFITGVLPITIDDLTSSYNIGTFLTLDASFEDMLGFTQEETNQLLDEIYTDFLIDPATRRDVDEVIKKQYDGYHFVNPSGQSLYNSTMLMYFLRQFCDQKIIPKHLTDLNLRTDLSWIQRITKGSDHAEELISELLTSDTIAYDDDYLVTKFNKAQFFTKGYYPISLFYLGLLTRDDQFRLRIPNMNIRKIFAEYFNELLHIDVSTKYEDMMRSFIQNPDLPRLFADYWRLYISQLPEAVFTRVNENFYRTTFYELCSRYLSTWFTWNIERSYPEGRSDLEFVGKYHEKFAGIRWIIEFKYFSNAELSRLSWTIDEFNPPNEDIMQIQGYAQGLNREYPHNSFRLFLIYCFGNQGFCVFEI